MRMVGTVIAPEFFLKLPNAAAVSSANVENVCSNGWLDGVPS
jgi:hypothetical protein